MSIRYQSKVDGCLNMAFGFGDTIRIGGKNGVRNKVPVALTNQSCPSHLTRISSDEGDAVLRDGFLRIDTETRIVPIMILQDSSMHRGLPCGRVESPRQRTE